MYVKIVYRLGVKFLTPLFMTTKEIPVEGEVLFINEGPVPCQQLVVVGK